MSIVDPFTVSVDYDTEINEEIFVTNIEVVIEAILVRLAYEDYRILTTILESLPTSTSMSRFLILFLSLFFF